MADESLAHGPLEIFRTLIGQIMRKISWQQGHKNLSKYIDWINSCRLIVTCDSLGQAVAQALGKKVVTFMAPPIICVCRGFLM